MKKRLNISFIAIYIIMVFCCQYAYSQTENVVIQGKVVDKKKKTPIEHVSVTEIDKDGRTVKGVATNIDGNYALRISNPKGRISISYIGFRTIVEDIKGRTNINISLDEASSDLDDVVITVQKKTDNGQLPIADRDLTTSTVKIGAKDLEEMQAASIDQALQGRLAGVDIVANSGDPGAAMSIRIRGTSSINGSSNPLIVVDGMPYETAIPSDFNFGTADDQGYAQLLNISPADIKEITVLKDAAATAIWGSRASGGVLIITTKRGSVSPPVISYTLRATIGHLPNAIPMLNGDQYSTLIPEEYQNKTGAALSRFAYPELSYDPSNPYYYYNYGQNTNWLKAVSQTATTADHSLSLVGGGQKARYFVSLNYLNQQGATIGTDLTRITTRVNLDYVVSDRLRFKTDVSYGYTDNPKSYLPSIPGNNANAAFEIRNVAINKMPNMSIYEYNERGEQTPNYFSPASNIQGLYPGTYNPVAMANTGRNRLLTNRITPHFNLEYTIVPKLLKLTGDLQFDINSNKSKSFLPQIATGRPFTETTVNRAYDGDLDGFNVQSKTNLVYTPQMPRNHSFLGLVSIMTNDNKSVSYQAMTSNTASSELQDASVPSRTANADLNVASAYGQTRSIGALLNFQYGYKDKYILNGGIRGDGNSRFGPAHRYGMFPSISGRWRVSAENFMSPFKRWLDDLSLKGSYGQSGNAPSKDYTFYNVYGTYANNYAGLAGTYPAAIELNNLKWEVVNGTNFGVALVMFKRAVDISLDIYKNRTTDLLFPNLLVSSYNGYDAISYLNGGTLDNQGWEFNVMTTPYKSKDWIINFNFNISHNENVIRAISPFYPQTKGKLTVGGQYLTMLQVNNPFGSFYGYKYKGVYKDADATVAKDVKGVPISDPNGNPLKMRFNYPTDGYAFQPGDAQYEDINHDGNIDSRDVVYLGNSNPKYSGGFGPTVSFKKNWKFSAFFNFRQGYEVINGTKITTTSQNGFNNQSTAVLRRWRNPGDVTDVPRAVYNQPYNWLGSDRYVEDASFLRFRTMTVRYNFLPKNLQKVKFKSLSAYVTVENILTFTKYTGQDPEVSTSGQGALTTTVDNSTTPPIKMITLGLSASF